MYNFERCMIPLCIAGVAGDGVYGLDVNFDA